jgi:hypothetical protein
MGGLSQIEAVAPDEARDAADIRTGRSGARRI